MRGLALWATFALMLAGCSGDAPSKPAQDDVFAGLEDEAAPTATTGAIAGVVVDDAIRPLAGANVTLVSLERTAQTGDDGRFSFDGLEPGTYFVAADAGVRHEDAQVSVDVLAGEVATVRVLLAAKTGAIPYHTTIQYRGHVENWLGTANFAIEAAQPGTLGCTCAWDVQLEANLTTVMMEATGSVAVPNPGTPATVPGDAYWEVFSNGTAGSLKHSAYDEFPVVKRFSSDSFEDATSIGVRITCGVWPCVTMDYDLFLTLFYIEEAPEEWSFLAGDT